MKSEAGHTEKNFEEIYLTYFSRLKYFAKEYILSEEEAENIVQDVFMEVWEKKEILFLHPNLLAYLFTGIKNRCLNFLRHQTIKTQAVNRLQEEYQITFQMNLDSLEAFDDKIFSGNTIEKIISDAIASLPEKSRQIFVMNKLEGKKQKEIASELHISINTVETQMGIAYKKLREILKDYQPLFLFLLYL